MPNKRDIKENKDQYKLRIYMKNPLNQRKKSQTEIDEDFSLSLILKIIEYKIKNLEEYYINKTRLDPPNKLGLYPLRTFHLLSCATLFPTS